MSVLENVLPELKGLVDEGLYLDNLRKMENLSRGLLLLEIYPVVFYILKNIFYELRMFWRNGAVTAKEYEYVQTQLNGPIQNILTSVQLSRENEVIAEQLDSLVREFIKVQFHLQNNDH